MARRTKEEWKTYGNVFDQFTIQNLQKLSGQGHFVGLKSAIALGKEANIFSAEKDDGSLIIVKIYRLENCNFNKMHDYLIADKRYMNTKRGKRQIIFAWCQREFKNLMNAREIIKVPTPITFKDNIILMEFIGDAEPAEQLKNSRPKNIEAFYKKTISNMKKLYDSGLVHADLSGFNILNNHDEPVFIDFSQGTTSDSPHATELLQRDCRNIAQFFKRLGVETSEEEIFKSIVVSSNG